MGAEEVLTSKESESCSVVRLFFSTAVGLGLQGFLHLDPGLQYLVWLPDFLTIGS